MLTFPSSVTEIRTKRNQRKIIRVDPDDAELWVVGVVSRYILENLQELVAIWEQQRRSVNAVQDAEDGRKQQMGKRCKPGSSSSANATMWIPSRSSSWN